MKDRDRKGQRTTLGGSRRRESRAASRVAVSAMERERCLSRRVLEEDIFFFLLFSVQKGSVKDREGLERSKTKKKKEKKEKKEMKKEMKTKKKKKKKK